MLSLNDLRSPAAGLDWHEAVAVGAALGALLAEAQAPACPRPSDVTLLPSGDLRVTGPGHVEGSAAAGAAHLLGQLLEAAPCPAELRQLVEAYATDRRSGAAGVEAVTDFVSELAFFERPGRREVLSSIAQRAEPAIERALRAAALEALTERTRLAAAGAPGPVAVVPAAHGAPEVEEGSRGGEPPHDGAGRLIVPAAVGLAAFLAVAYITAAWLDRPAPPGPRAEAIEDDLPISGPDVRTAKAASPAVGAPQSPRSSVPPHERPSGGSVSAPSAADASKPSAAAPAGSAAPALVEGPRPVDVLIAERDGRVVPSPVAPLRPVPSGHVFQAGDPQVTPAVLIRPHLPDNPPPDVPEEHIGTLEFVVGESGAVEHVHLVSPANRYQERMLVAAAKTWQFRPATRDGRPVRFRTRMRVTL
jgi:hypothetical protein